MSNGLNDFAQNTEMRIALREPFPPKLILTVDKGSHSEDYVNHAAVTDRLNAEAPGWTNSKPEFLYDGTGKHIAGVVCSMTIGSVTRWEVGDVDRSSNLGAEAKLAMSDFLKRAAMRFGVGLDLWSKAELRAPAASPSRRSEPSTSVGPDGPTDGETASDMPADQVSEVSGDGAVSLPIYLSKDDQALLGEEFGNKKKALDAYRAMFGERIRSLGDITRDMRDRMADAMEALPS